MGVTYTIFSPISAAEMLAVETALARELERYDDEHEDVDNDDRGEMGIGGFLPTPTEVEAVYRQRLLRLDPEILARLGTCRSAFGIYRPGDISIGGTQVAAMRFVLERTGAGLALLGDYPLVPTEILLTQLARLRGSPRLGGPAPAAARPRKPVPRRDARPGEVRALRLVGVLESAQEDPAIAIDIRAIMERAPALARAYLALLLDAGAMSDAQAAKRLSVSVGELSEAVEGVVAAFDAIE